MTADDSLKQIHREASSDAMAILDRLRESVKFYVKNRPKFDPDAGFHFEDERDASMDDGDIDYDEEAENKVWNGDDEHDTSDSSDPEDESLIEEAEGRIDEAVELVKSRDTSSLLRAVEELDQLSNEYQLAYDDQLDIGVLLESLGDCATRLSISEIEPIYSCEESSIILPKLILPVTQFLIEKVKANINYIYELTPRQFEEMIAELFFRNGFKVELTKMTRDGGKDIIAISNELDIPVKYIIECKHYASHRKVSIEYVQRLLGVKVSENANKGILVTTSCFSKDAITFANRHFWDLSLKDLGDISAWLK